MACGCNKNRASRRTSGAIRPGTTRSIVTAQNSRTTPEVQVQAQSLNSTGLTAEKRKTQAARRDAINRAFGK